MSDAPPDPRSTFVANELESFKSAPWYFLKDTKGQKSVTVTLVMVSFFVTVLAYILSIFEKVGPVTIRPFDVGACGVLLAPILTLYFARRHTDANAGASK